MFPYATEYVVSSEPLTTSGKTSFISCAIHPVEGLPSCVYVYPLILDSLSKAPSIFFILDLRRLSEVTTTSVVARMVPVTSNS